MMRGWGGEIDAADSSGTGVENKIKTNYVSILKINLVGKIYHKYV